MPSGVITAMSVRTSVALPSVDKKCIRGCVGAGPDHLGGKHRGFLMSIPETHERAQALCFCSFTFQLLVENLQLVDSRMQPQIFGACAPQPDVSVPNVSDPRKGPGAAALERRHRFHSPIPDQSHIVVALDLESQQQYLREDHGRPAEPADDDGKWMYPAF